MANATKKLLDDDDDPITVYSFAGSIIVPTEQGAYWANAVGGVVESRPTGNPFILFSLKYIWGLDGAVSEFPTPILIRLNTAMAVTESLKFEFPAPEVPADDPLLLQAEAEQMATGGDEGDGESEPDEDGDEIDDEIDDEEGDEIDDEEGDEIDDESEPDEAWVHSEDDDEDELGW